MAGALSVMASGALAQTPAPAPDPAVVAQRAAAEKAFDQAVAAARASLSVFWGRLAENPGGAPDDFSLKVAFNSPRGGYEALWLTDIHRDGAHIVGRLNYDPDTLTGLHRLQIVPIPEAAIIDWSFKEGRKRYGHFTTRVLAKLNPDDAAKTLATLSEDPLPADARAAP